MRNFCQKTVFSPQKTPFLVIFCHFFVMLSIFSPVFAQLAGQAVKGFSLPEYDEHGKLKHLLTGETATFLPDGIIQIEDLKIEMYKEGEIMVRVTSPMCLFEQKQGKAASKERIRIVADQALITGDGFAWNGQNEQFQIFKNARVVLDGGVDPVDLLAPPPAMDESDVEALE